MDIKQFSNPREVIAKGKQLGLDVMISTRKGKKYMVVNPAGKTIHFGAMGYQDYTKHKDEKRRESFLSRNNKWKDADPYSASFLSYYLLWL